jgi:excisionase family DNA binding protein
MPVIRRKLASTLVPTTDQRGMKVIPAAKYLGTSVSQVRKFIREGVLKPYRIANKQYLDRFDLDALIERLKAAAI